MAKTNKKETVQVPQSRLDELLVEVTGELNTMLKAEADALSKAEGDDEPSEQSSGSDAGAPADDIAPEASPEASAPAAPPAAPEASAPAAMPPPPAPDAAAPGAEASAAPTLDELVAAYSELPPEQLDMHLQAATMAAQASASAAAPAPEASAPAAPPAPPAPAPEASAPPMMGKSEVPAAAKVAASPGNGGMRKSEKDPEIELLKQQIELQKKEVEMRDKALGELVESLHQIPQRKSIARISEIQVQGKPGESLTKSEDQVDLTSMDKKEVTKLLRERARDASLSKSDRGLINGFYSGKVGIDKLGHLLASAK